ncbi:8009_t:CDS:2 [Paraglomus occultum]|uniref:8009_t:CDS:1 n=1 Tax=Paraglomus occultum TaxID=144539 RepID=A0A9N9AKR4_9GLOM|nr:8009_t:CDS:2 [Paraglomus occultum]
MASSLDELQEPRLKSTKHFEHLCTSAMRDIHEFFKLRKASLWSLQSFIAYVVEQGDYNHSFEQILLVFEHSLELINELHNSPLPIRAHAVAYVAWLQTLPGQGLIQGCRRFFEAQKLRKQSNVLEEAVETARSKSLNDNAKQTPFGEFGSAKANIEFDMLVNYVYFRTLNFFMFDSYYQDACIVCAFGKTSEELEKEIGVELAQKVLAVRDINPAVWTPELEKYLDSTLVKTYEDFKMALQEPFVDDNNRFRLYCEKVLLDFYHLTDINRSLNRKISERKYIVYHIGPLFKYYEATFGTVEFDWVESHERATKITKSADSSGIVLVDAKGTRTSDDKEIWHLEVAGPPWNPTTRHTVDDSKKMLRTDIFNLVAILLDHLDSDIKLATKIKVFCVQAISTRLTLYATNMCMDGRFLVTELATVIIPFSFNARVQYKSVLRMMGILHDEFEKQEKLLEEMNRHVLRFEGSTVRQVLNVPKGMQNIPAEKTLDESLASTGLPSGWQAETWWPTCTSRRFTVRMAGKVILLAPLPIDRQDGRPIGRHCFKEVTVEMAGDGLLVALPAASAVKMAGKTCG